MKTMRRVACPLAILALLSVASTARAQIGIGDQEKIVRPARGKDAPAAEPDQKPAPQPAARTELDRLREEVRTLRAENARLKTQLAAAERGAERVGGADAKHGPTTRPTTRNAKGAAEKGSAGDARSATFASCAALLDALPEDCRPAAGETWDGLRVAKANEWFKTHAAGRAFAAKLQLEEQAASPAEDDGAKNPVELTSKPMPIEADGFNYTGSVRAQCPATLAAKAAALSSTDPVSLKGTIKRVYLSSGGARAAITVYLDNASF